MDRRSRRAGGASLVALAVLALAPAAQAAGVGVTSLSSLPAGAKAGNLTGLVTNESDSATNAAVSVRVMRRGTGGALIGKTSVAVAAHSAKSFLVNVKVPASLKKGTYYVAACTPQGGADKGALGCATSAADLKIKGGDPLQGKLATRAFDVQNGTVAASGKAHASQAPACTPGARTLSEPGNRVWPELGNGGYKSLHTDVFTVYDAVTDKFLPGNHVELTQQSTQCLSEFSLDFDRKNNISSTATTPGPDMTISSITIDGVPATFAHKQPTYAGDPNGLDDPDPLAHQASNTNPVSATNPNPPACAPINNNASSQGAACGDTKLVITPAQPIPAGTTFKVVINYTGQPGIRSNPSLGNEGWFKNNSPAGEGAMVTSEPSGTMAWMPLNNQASVKPTYDIHTTINYDPALVVGGVDPNRVAIANGRLVSKVINPPDANFPSGGSRTFNWHSAEPVASYLVENSVGHFDESERTATAGDVLYYEFQSSNIAAAKKLSNKAIMDQQEDITHFQEQQVNGPFQFNANGIIVATPSASFEEEMQTKIVFVGGSITAQTFAHENMHQWWGDAVSYAQPKYTFFKEGYADMSEYLHIANLAGLAAGPAGSDAYKAAFEASIVSRFNGTGKYLTTSTSFWGVAPANPTSGNLFSNANTYSRPGMSYIALRAILGPDNFRKASTELQTTYRYGSVVPQDEIAVFHKYMPNQSAACSAKLDQFFQQWWFTSYTGSPAAGNRPQLTGPGLAGGGFYDASCPEITTANLPAGGTVPATLSLTLGVPATFAPFSPGIAKTYTASTTANVISSAGDAAVSVTDPSSTAPGHLVNGTFSLPAALKATATSAAGTAGAGGAVSGSPLTLLTYSGPTANDTVTVNLAQDIAANDALRTGTYSKTLTFTLSTTTP
ncbi:M1 family aminopeptidase [Solirubrobacter ginsenosidimutans]|uniref:M1 family aminopeptidase n=1 Tax=Solirubrobacter ginsenosidimutans TaxID=490573 RepID=A0A9X3S3R4_9ACTN|nr:M1 family aminopeptidase [Solirubrobacter ginsenosidimutans]MDA0162361.1 M1 family aminopeptidase [Solirubrobacter ginsenosidimutans]